MSTALRSGAAGPSGIVRPGGSGEKKEFNRANIGRVARSFRPYQGQTLIIAVAVLASAALGLVPSLLLKPIVNKGIVAHDLGVITRLSVFALLTTLAATACSLAYSFQSIIVGQRIMRDLRVQLYTQLQAMSLEFFTDTRTGEIQSRLANDVSGVQSVVSDTVATLLNNFSVVISTVVFMVIMDWRLTLLSVGILPLFAVIGQQVGARARKVRKRTQELLANMNSTMQETLSISGILLTKTSGRQDAVIGKFAAESESLSESQIRQSIIYRVFFNMIGLSFSVTPVLVYWLAGFLIGRHAGNLSLGTIVAFTALQVRLFFPLQGLLNSQVDITSSFALFDRIYEYLDLKPEIVDAPNAVALAPSDVRGQVTFEQATFRYSAEQTRPTLDGVTFAAQPGELVALVGHSGAGKTTLTYLIPRLYDVDSGRVTIDGCDVRQIALASLGKIIGVVTQETYLVHDTIRENLRFGKPDATDAEIAAACKVAAIDDHIMSLPEGYDTVVGERGYKLSGGEKQRIAIARAVLKDPRILILDEATSALDTQSERLVQAALEPLMRGRTTFAIAHRLSTILQADRIVVMDAGRVVEQGTHADLLARGGYYARLYRLQFADGEPTTLPI